VASTAGLLRNGAVGFIGWLGPIGFHAARLCKFWSASEESSRYYFKSRDNISFNVTLSEARVRPNPTPNSTFNALVL
jgi:hypothetical protein